MAKASGIGDRLYIDGYDLSGDIGSVDTIADRGNLLEVTGIDKSAVERIVGLGDGEITFTAYFNDAAGAAHARLKTRGTGNHVVQYHHGSSLGGASVQLTGKQVDYSGDRASDGSLQLGVQVMGSDGEGLSWGRSLTAGARTDTSATNGSSVDDGAATATGLRATLTVLAFSGTDVTIKLQDSANNSAWADITGGAFTAVTSAPQAQTITTGTTAAVRRYVRVVTTTSGGFTSVTFAVVYARR